MGIIRSFSSSDEGCWWCNWRWTGRFGPTTAVEQPNPVSTKQIVTLVVLVEMRSRVAWKCLNIKSYFIMYAKGVWIRAKLTLWTGRDPDDLKELMYSHRARCQRFSHRQHTYRIIGVELTPHPWPFATIQLGTLCVFPSSLSSHSSLTIRLCALFST